MRTKNPTGKPFINKATQDIAAQKSTAKAKVDKAQTSQQTTKAQTKAQDQNSFAQSKGPADLPSVNYQQKGGSNPFTGGPLIAVNPMIEPEPIKPAINPLPDTVQVEPDPAEPSINPLPDVAVEPDPVEPSINPIPDVVIEPSINPIPDVVVEPDPVEPSINPIPDVVIEPSINPIPDVVVEPDPVEPSINPIPDVVIEPSINPIPDTMRTPLAASADKATELAMQELPYPLVLANMKELIKSVPELWARLVGEPDDAMLTSTAESFLKFGDKSAGQRLLDMAALE